MVSLTDPTLPSASPTAHLSLLFMYMLLPRLRIAKFGAADRVEQLPMPTSELNEIMTGNIVDMMVLKSGLRTVAVMTKQAAPPSPYSLILHFTSPRLSLLISVQAFVVL